MAHTERVIAVYVDIYEKEEIRKAAIECGKSMSRYLLDLHLKNVVSNLKRRSKNHADRRPA